MNLKTSMLTVAMLLVPAAAFADHVAVGIRVGDRGYTPAPPPPSGAPSQNGRYELRSVSRWVPGYQERVWVAEQCFSKHGRRHHGRSMKCRGGYYETRWVPGYQEQVQDWVWVPARPRPPGFEIRLSSAF